MRHAAPPKRDIAVYQAVYQGIAVVLPTVAGPARCGANLPEHVSSWLARPPRGPGGTRQRAPSETRS